MMRISIGVALATSRHTIDIANPKLRTLSLFGFLEHATSLDEAAF